MKTTILFLSLVTALFGQNSSPLYFTSSSFTFQDTPITADCYLRLTPDGSYVREPGVNVSVVSMTQKQLILECNGTIAWHSRLYMVVGGQREYERHIWREVYAIECGKLMLKKIQRPKVTPATEAKIEWGCDDLEVKP